MLEFHDDFIRLDEKPKYAVRFNLIDDNGEVRGPYLFNPWPQNFSGAISESNPAKNVMSFCSHGIFAVPLKLYKDADDVVCETIRNGKARKDIVLMLVQYYESDIVSISKKIYIEVVLRQCNILKTIIGIDFFRFLENDGDSFIKDFECKQQLMSFKSYAKEVERWDIRLNELGGYIKQEKKDIFSMLLFLTNYVGQIEQRADSKIIAFFPFYMMIVENWKRDYPISYKEYVKQMVYSRRNNFERYQYYGLVKCLICCLDGSPPNSVEEAICQDAYYIANHFQQEEIKCDKLNLKTSYMAFNNKEVGD